MPNVKWELGQKLVDGFKSTLGNGVKNAVVRNVNDLCIMLDGAGRLREAVESAFKLGFDHVKSINVIDLINAGVFRMEYVLGSYTNRGAYASVLLPYTSMCLGMRLRCRQ